MIIPYTDEWVRARIGKITGSEVHLILGSEAQRLNYLGLLISEILTGQVKTFTSKPTDTGIAREKMAISLYEFEYQPVKPTEFITKGDRLACTPDGFIDDGIIEVKSPYQPVNHFMCFLKGIPKKYYPQLQFNMWITDSHVCDFVSYSPDAHASKQLYVEPVYIDYPYIEKMKAKIDKFISELDSLLDIMLTE